MSDDRAALRINLIEFPNGLNFIVQLDLARIYSKRIINSIGTPSNYEINWLCELVWLPMKAIPIQQLWDKWCMHCNRQDTNYCIGCNIFEQGNGPHPNFINKYLKLVLGSGAIESYESWLKVKDLPIYSKIEDPEPLWVLFDVCREVGVEVERA